MADSAKDSRQCARCGATEGKGSIYCGSCGAPVVNRCLGAGQLLGEPCNYVNEDSAAFCTRCGSHTAYHQAGLVFTTYPENKVLQKDEVDEMNWFFHPFFYD